MQRACFRWCRHCHTDGVTCHICMHAKTFTGPFAETPWELIMITILLFICHALPVMQTHARAAAGISQPSLQGTQLVCQAICKVLVHHLPPAVYLLWMSLRSTSQAGYLDLCTWLGLLPSHRESTGTVCLGCENSASIVTCPHWESDDYI